MSQILSVGSVIDKNRITSDVAWVVLLKIDITDPNDRTIVETVRVARNNEDVLFNGEVFVASNFEFNIDQRQNQASTVGLVAQDQTRYLQQRIEEMAGGVFSAVEMTVVNTERLDRPPEIQERFRVNSSSVKDDVVTFELGAENPLAIQFPKHVQRQDRCAWRFKGYGCEYAGVLATCDYTKDGANGCNAHNFRALAGLVRMNI